MAGPDGIGRTDGPPRVDTRVRVGSVELRHAVMTASGTAGYGTELAPYLDLGVLGAVVTKSLAAFAWDGNPAPRLHPTPAGMLNSVGLQGPGVASWLEHQVPELADAGATVVCSIWGRTVDEYRAAAELLAEAPGCVVAVEVNLSCPNLSGHGRAGMFAHDADLAASAITATAGCGRPRWAKLSPNTDRVVEVAEAVAGAGAEAVTLVNTLFGMLYDPDTLHPALGSGPNGGGLSGRAIHPVAVRIVHDVHRARPELPIIGVGGVASGWDAAELMLAGASAVQVGTASFADPAASGRVAAELEQWAARHGMAALADIPGHAGPGAIA
jgi:dihydroorotate dehydrogenase (NAD+) catalytic subunit